MSKDNPPIEIVLGNPSEIRVKETPSELERIAEAAEAIEHLLRLLAREKGLVP